VPAAGRVSHLRQVRAASTRSARMRGAPGAAALPGDGRIATRVASRVAMSCSFGSGKPPRVSRVASPRKRFRCKSIECRMHSR
jgi:hypothetical protein